MTNSKFFKTYLLPGFIFQSITIGGGYGTGRELIEFFMSNGPLNGLLSMGVATFVWSIILALSFEVARVTKSFNYRTFIKAHLGKFWISYEVVYLVGLVLVLSVMGAAAGTIFGAMVGVPDLVGIILMISIVGVLSYFGTSLIEKTLAYWSIALYVVFSVLVIASFSLFGESINTKLGDFIPDTDWVLDGIRYAGYNIGLVPAMIYVSRHFETRNEALLSGVLGGVIAMLPGVFIYIAMVGLYPEVLSSTIPVDLVLNRIGWDWFTIFFRIILFGTFIETGVGLVHGFNERIAGALQEEGSQLSSMWRSIIAMGFLALAVFVADAVGIIQLIAHGYGTLTWGYILVYVIPVLILGGYTLWKPRSN